MALVIFSDNRNMSFICIIQLKLKEGMYIGWENPELNKQVKYVSSTLCV